MIHRVANIHFCVDEGMTRGSTLRIAIVSIDEGSLSPSLDFQKVLHRSEQKILDTLKAESRKNQFLLGRLAAKLSLGLTLESGEMNRVAILPDIFGKPTLNSKLFLPCEVSISHVQNLAVAASVCQGEALGIDVEIIRPALSGIAPVIISPKDRQILNHGRWTAQGELEGLVWSAKEAASKAIGRGMFEALEKYELGAFEIHDGKTYRFLFQHLPQIATNSCVRGSLVLSVAGSDLSTCKIPNAIVQQLEKISRQRSDYIEKDLYAA